MLFQNQDMIRNQREENLSTRQQITNTNTTTTTSRSWSSGGLKNPRIVRVSRAFGGKDRHSKVTTIKGLRDRRVRLSVPTAIQLYDLQDRLGLNQPSKVVDWLINAAQPEIDKLPPLNFPPEDHDPMAQIAEEQKVGASSTTVHSNVQVLSHDMTSYGTYCHWEATNAYLLGIRSTNDQDPVMPVPYFCPPGMTVPSMFASSTVNVSPVQANLEMNSFDYMGGTMVRQYE